MVFQLLSGYIFLESTLGQNALEDKSVYLCQKTVITMKNQVRPVCSPKDKIWLQTDKLQRCRRLPLDPLEQAKLRKIQLENKSEGVLFRKWFDRWYVAVSQPRSQDLYPNGSLYAIDFTVKLITFSFPNNRNPARATNTFRTKCNNFHNIHHDGSIPVCLALTIHT